MFQQIAKMEGARGFTLLPTIAEWFWKPPAQCVGGKEGSIWPCRQQGLVVGGRHFASRESGPTGWVSVGHDGLPRGFKHHLTGVLLQLSENPI